MTVRRLTYLSSLLDELLGHVGKVFDHVFGHFEEGEC